MKTLGAKKVAYVEYMLLMCIYIEILIQMRTIQMVLIFHSTIFSKPPDPPMIKGTPLTNQPTNTPTPQHTHSPLHARSALI